MITSLKTFVDDHWEKVIMVISILLLGYFLYAFYLVSQASTERKKLQSLRKNLSSAMAEEKSDLDYPDVAGRVRNKLNRKIQDNDGRLFTFYNPPLVKPSIKKLEDVETYSMPTPKLSEPVVKLGEISLSWNLKFTNNKHNRSEITQQTLYRKEEGGDWKEIGVVTGTSYTDTNFEPRMEYSYKLEVETNTTPYEGTRTKRFVGKEKKLSNVVSARTKSRYEISFVASMGQQYIFKIYDRLKDSSQQTKLLKEGDPFNGKYEGVETGYTLEKVVKESYEYINMEKDTGLDPSSQEKIKFCECTKRELKIQRFYYQGPNGRTYSKWVEKQVEGVKERNNVVEKSACPGGQIGKRAPCN